MTTNANPAEIVNGETAPNHNEKPKKGARQIGECIGATERQAAYLLATGQIKCAVKKGGRYWAYPSKLRAEFGG